MFQFFPWSNAHQLNLDWILEFIKHLPWTVNGKEPDPETHNINLAGWEGGVLEIPDGGTGMTGISSTTVQNDILASIESDIDINAIRIVWWGKVAAIRLRFKSSTALSGNSDICTLVSRFRPSYEMGLEVLDNNNPGYSYITATGKIVLNASLPANTYTVIEGLYLIG